MITCAKISPMFTREYPDDPGQYVAVVDVVTSPRPGAPDFREEMDEAFASGREVTMCDGDSRIRGIIKQMSPDRIQQLPTEAVYVRSAELELTAPPQKNPQSSLTPST